MNLNRFPNFILFFQFPSTFLKWPQIGPLWSYACTTNGPQASICISQFFQCLQRVVFKPIKRQLCTTFHLLREEGRFIGSVRGCVARAPHGLHVGNRHTQYGQFVGFSGQGAAGGDHVRQLGDVLGHFVASASLNLTVVLP